MENKPVILDHKDSDILRFQLHRHITLLFKEFLMILEEIDNDHSAAMQRVYENLPNEYKKYLNLADFLTEEKFSSLRSKVLKEGNDTIRALEDHLNNYDITIKRK